MPTYEYECPNGHVFEVAKASYRDRKPVEPCPECGRNGERYFGNPPAVRMDMPPHVDEHISCTGSKTLVKSRAHRRELMRRNGLREAV